MRKKKDNNIEGQLTLAMCLNTNNYVVQSNDLVNSRQNLNLNEAKLIRTAIMQIKADDTEFNPYVISVKEFSDLIGTSPNNVYRDVEKICRGIARKPIEVKISTMNKEKKVTKWATIPWVKRCEYDTGTGCIYIKLNEELKPWLLGLKQHYNQYTLDVALAMNSQYGIRIYEMINSRIYQRILPKEGVTITIGVDEIRDACKLESKYERFGSLRQKVIDVAIKEIERTTLYRISYTYKKEGSRVVALNFHINMCYH